MARRHYTSNARETSLTAGINSSATTIAVDNPVGYPTETPFIILCELGTSSEEIMLVTAVVGSNWTVVRGYDGSTAVAHDLGAKIVHGVSAIDMDEANEHVNASTNVHGLAGGAAVVGTTSSQTLTNKTLTSPTINGGTLNSVTLGSGLTLQSPTLVTPTIADFTNAQHTHEDAASGGEISGGGGGGSSGLAYRRSSTSDQEINLSSLDDSGAVAISFGTLDYNVGGNTTWAVSSGNTRITLPTDVDDAVWHVSVSVLVSVETEFDAHYINIVHQDHGVIANDGDAIAVTSNTVQRRYSCSTDFQANSGRWIEVRIASAEEVPTSVFMERRSISIHRVA